MMSKMSLSINCKTIKINVFIVHFFEQGFIRKEYMVSPKYCTSAQKAPYMGRLCPKGFLSKLALHKRVEIIVI